MSCMLVTGGSRGIGRAVAILAAGRGWDVALTWREDEASAERVVGEIESDGGRAVAIRADVADETDVVAAFDSAEAAFGRLGCVVVNAGIIAPHARFLDMSLDRWRRIFEVNVLGAMLTAREAAKRMKGADGGASASLVFVSSMAARLGSPGEYVDYAASKGAIDTLTLGLARELAADNIRVNAVRPGIIETDIHASGGSPDRAARLGPSSPLGRSGRPEEVAEAILYFASDAASYSTGTLIDVSGGR